MCSNKPVSPSNFFPAHSLLSPAFDWSPLNEKLDEIKKDIKKEVKVLDAKITRHNKTVAIVAKEVDIQHRVRMDIWTESKRTKVEQSDFKEALVTYYERNHPSEQNFLKCMVMNRFFSRETVIASHIWKYSTNGRGLEEFGLPESSVSEARNGLLLCKNIEQAFDTKRLCFLIDRLRPTIFYLKVLDPSLLDAFVVSESNGKTFRRIDGATLQFPENRYPYRRILDFHAKCSYRIAISRRWLQANETFSDFFDLSIDASIPDIHLFHEENFLEE